MTLRDDVRRLRDADAGGVASGSESVGRGSGVDRVGACAGAGCAATQCVNHQWPHQPNAMPTARHTMAKTPSETIAQRKRNGSASALYV